MISSHPEKAMYSCLHRFIFKCLISGLLSFAIFLSASVQADEKRHHDAHEHGAANLNIAVEGDNIYIEFSSPAANIVGFEHHPRTPDQKDAVADAVNKLKKGDALFLLSTQSESKLVKSEVDTDIIKDTDHHSESQHTHTEKEHHDKEHGEVNEHERHSEFEAQYHFTCEKPDKLSQIDVMLFQTFPGIEHIEVQLISDTQQTAMELTATKNKISF